MKFDDYIPQSVCIYKITNLKTNLILIGSTNNLYKRIIQYKYDILHKRDNCINKRFMQDSILYGIDNLNVEILEEFDNINSISLKNKETEYIIKYNSLDLNIGYNIRLDKNGKYICNLSTKILKQNQLKEQWANGIRDKHSDKMKNYWKNISKERKDNQSNIMTKNLTKYYYNIYDINNNLIKNDLSYKDLKSFFNINVTSLFSQKEKQLNKDNKSSFKIICYKIIYLNKYIIERKYIKK